MNQNEQLREISDTVKRIETVLIGDKFQEDGLIHIVQQHNEKIECLEEDRKRRKWTFYIISVGAGVVAFLTSLFANALKIFE